VTFYVDPSQPPGHRVAMIQPVPRGTLRPGMIGGLPVMALSMDGQNGPAWGIGRTVLAGRYIIALPGCDDDPAKRAARYVHAMRFPTGADAARLGELVRQTIAATGHAAAHALHVAATKHAAEIAAIIARTQPEPGTAV
jgi:hypothetical protein